MSAIAVVLYITLPSLLTISRAAALKGNSRERALVGSESNLERVQMNLVRSNAEKPSWNYLFLLRKTLSCLRPLVSLIYDLYDEVLLERLRCRPVFQWFFIHNAHRSVLVHCINSCTLNRERPFPWNDGNKILDVCTVKIVYDVTLKGHVKFKHSSWKKMHFVLSKIYNESKLYTDVCWSKVDTSLCWE